MYSLELTISKRTAGHGGFSRNFIWQSLLRCLSVSANILEFKFHLQKRLVLEGF